MGNLYLVLTSPLTSLLVLLSTCSNAIATVPVLLNHWWKITLLIYSVILGSHNGPLKQIILATNLWKQRHFNWLLAFDHMSVPCSFILTLNRMNIHAHSQWFRDTQPTIIFDILSQIYTAICIQCQNNKKKFVTEWEQPCITQCMEGTVMYMYVHLFSGEYIWNN